MGGGVAFVYKGMMQNKVNILLKDKKSGNLICYSPWI